MRKLKKKMVSMFTHLPREIMSQRGTMATVYAFIFFVFSLLKIKFHLLILDSISVTKTWVQLPHVREKCEALFSFAPNPHESNKVYNAVHRGQVWWMPQFKVNGRWTRGSDGEAPMPYSGGSWQKKVLWIGAREQDGQCSPAAHSG